LSHWASRRSAGGPDAIAGYGTGNRLEYLLIPLVFGLGAPMVALVGTNIGAGQGARALRIALTGSTQSPPIDAVLWALGRTEAMDRILAAAEA